MSPLTLKLRETAKSKVVNASVAFNVFLTRITTFSANAGTAGIRIEIFLPSCFKLYSPTLRNCGGGLGSSEGGYKTL